MAEQRKIEGVYEIRIEQGPALRKFEELKKSLDNTRAGIRDLNKETKGLIAQEAAIEKAVSDSGHATEEQVAALRRLSAERDATNKKLSEAVLTERALSAQVRELSNNLGGLTEHGLRFRDKMAEASTIALQQSGIIGELSKRHEQLSLSMDKVDAAMGANSAQVEALNAALAKGEVTQERYADEQARLVSELTDAKAAQKLIADEMERTNAITSKLDQQVGELNKELADGKINSKQYAESLKAIEASARTSAEATGNLNGKFDQFVRGQGQELRSGLSSLALQYIGVGAAIGGVVNVIGGAVRTIADFDAQLGRISALGGEYAASITQISKAAREIGPKFNVGPKEAAESIEALAKAGVSAADILGGALEGALSLSAAGSLEAGQAAEYASATMVQFGLSGQDMTHVADLLAGAANKAMGEVSDFGNALKFIGPVAASMNVGLEETTGALALFASNGILGEQAGTGLRGVLSALTSPSKQAQEQMQALGIVTADGANALYDAQGNFKGLANMAGVLSEATAGLSQAQKDQALGQIFGNAQITAANVLLKGGAGAVNEWTDAVNDSGIANRIATEQLNTITGAAKGFGAAWDAAVLSLDNGKGPVSEFFKDVIQGATSALNMLVDFNAEVARTVQAATDTALQSVQNQQSVLREDYAQQLRNKEITQERYDALIAVSEQAIEKAKEQHEAESNTNRLIAEQRKALEEINAMEFDGVGSDSVATWAELNDEMVKHVAYAKIAAEDAQGLENAEWALNEARKESQAVLLTYQQEGENATHQTRREAEARMAMLDMLEKEVDRRKQAEAATTQQAIAQEQAAAAAQAEKNAKATSSTATVGQRLEYLNAELETAKKNRNDLTAADAAGIAAADRNIASIQRQIDALSGTAKATKQVSDAERDRLELVKELTAAENERSLAAKPPEEREVAEATATRDDRAAKAKGDADLLSRIEQEHQAQLAEIRERYAAARVQAEDTAAKALQDAQARAADAAVGAEEQQYADKVERVRRAAEAAGLAKEEVERRVAATQYAVDNELLADRMAQLDRQQEEERQRILEQYEALYTDAENAGQDTAALQEAAGQELAAITAKYNGLRVKANQGVTDSFLAAQQAERDAVVVGGEEITAVIERQLAERRAIEQQALDDKIAALTEAYDKQWALADTDGELSAEQVVAAMALDAELYAAKEQFRQNDMALQEQYNAYLAEMSAQRTMRDVEQFQQVAASAQQAVGSIIELIDQQTQADVAAIDQRIAAAEREGQSTEALEREKANVVAEGAKKRAAAQRVSNIITAMSAIAAAVGQAAAAAAPGDPYTVALRIASAVAAATAAAAAVYKAIAATPAMAAGGTVQGQRQPYGDKVFTHLAPGEEVISNRRGQADRYRALLKAINADDTTAIMRAFRAGNAAAGYAEGGTVGIVTPRPTPQNIVQNQFVRAAASISDRPLFVSVREINDVQDRVQVIESHGTL